MTLTGQTSHTVVTTNGIYVIRAESFQDDRFRLMFVCKNGAGRDVRWIPMKFKKGTKRINLDAIWPELEKEFAHA